MWTSPFDAVAAELKSLDIDEIKRRLEPLMVGFHITTPVFNAGTFVYRARQIGPQFRKESHIGSADLIYPPATKAVLGRVNRPGEPVFYGSMQKEAVFFELPGLGAGDELILTCWKTTERMLVNNIGYTEFAFEQLGAKRPVPDWNPIAQIGSEQTLPIASFSKEVAEAAMAMDDARDLKEAFSRYFTRQVNDDEAYRYKLTVALAEMHLGEITNRTVQFAGVLYPSVRMWANADNVGLQPWFVDQHLEFRKAIHVRIKDRRDAEIDIQTVDAAYNFDSSGKLNWLGRDKNWTVKPLQEVRAVLELGPDLDGDYYVSQDGRPSHWVFTDARTGEVIPPT